MKFEGLTGVKSYKNQSGEDVLAVQYTSGMKQQLATLPALSLYRNGCLHMETRRIDVGAWLVYRSDGVITWCPDGLFRLSFTLFEPNVTISRGYYAAFSEVKVPGTEVLHMNNGDAEQFEYLANQMTLREAQLVSVAFDVKRTSVVLTQMHDILRRD